MTSDVGLPDHPDFKGNQSAANVRLGCFGMVIDHRNTATCQQCPSMAECRQAAYRTHCAITTEWQGTADESKIRATAVFFEDMTSDE